MRKALFTFFIISMIGYAKGEPIKRFEIGFVLGSYNFGDVTSTNLMRAELGGRFAINLHQKIALEYQMTFSGRDIRFDSSSQGSGHIKYSVWRSERRLVDLFAIAGPGFTREETEYIGGLYHYIDKYRSLGVDYGGGIEVFPQEHLGIRFDLTDFYAGRKYASREDLRNDQTNPGYGPRRWDHHLDLKAGFMFRF